MQSLKSRVAGVLLLLASVAVEAHGHDNTDMSNMARGVPSNTTTSIGMPDLYGEPNYASLEAKSLWMFGHISFMVLAWFFTLPIGKFSM